MTQAALETPRDTTAAALAERRIDETIATDEFIAWTLERFHGWPQVLTTSFGMEGCALIDMYARHGAPLQVVYLDTMFFFPQTYALRDRLIARYPHLEFVNRGTGLRPEEQARRYGPELWKTDPDLCCRLRKVEPMKEVMGEVDLWISAIRRDQAPDRAAVRLIEWDWKFQVLKVSPLAHWSRQEVWDYIRANGVPYNELHEQGYPSIGCTHCTKPVLGSGPHEYTRLGRWADREKTECGLHSRQP